MSRNDFIVFEGIDGCWKDTQMMIFIEKLRKFNKYEQVFITREPSLTTDAWREISTALTSGGFKSPEDALRLYVTDRIERSYMYEQVAKYSTIVSSRYDLSTYAYQWMQWLHFNEILEFHDNVSLTKHWYVFEPTLTFLFDIDPVKVMERIETRGEKKEAFETLPQLEKARKFYLDAVNFLSKKKNRKTIIIDASKPIDMVSELVWQEYINFKGWNTKK